MNRVISSKYENLIRIAERVIFALMLLFFAYMIIVTFRVPLHNNAGITTSVVLTFVTAFFTMLLYSFCLSVYAWDMKLKRIFMPMLVVFYLANVIEFYITLCESRVFATSHLMLLYTLIYLLSAVYWISFWFFQRDNYQPQIGEKNFRILFFGFFAIYSVIAIVNYFTGFCFYISPEGEFIVRNLLLTTMTEVWFVIYILVTLTGRGSTKTRFTLASYALAPLTGLILLIIFRGSAFYLQIYTTLNLLLYLVSLYRLFFNIYIEHGQQLLQRENELAQSRINAMTLKISPHFIANTMSSIVALCYSDPNRAGELASKFAKYLRDNYVDMTENPMIPFSKELEHIKNYLSIEQIRFENLNVEYDIQADNFSLPTLTVQPLVENAVRHGISKRPGAAGDLLIRSYRDADDYVIQIRDNGVGYTEQIENNDKQHIGITNARYRLEALCNGTLVVTGAPDKGSLCEIRIPINKDEQ